MIDPLPDALLHALATQPEPLLHPLALPLIHPSVWESLEKDGLISREKNPSRILLDPGYSVAVRWSGDLCIGIDDSCDPPSTVPLKAEELLQYKLNLNELLVRVCEVNRINGRSGDLENGFCLIGRRRFAEGPACSVYFYRPQVLADSSLESRLAWLAQSGASHKLVIFPEWPDVDETHFEKHNLWIADLNPDLSVNWPPNMVSPKEADELTLVETEKEWQVTFEGTTLPVTNDKGMGHIAWLLRNPGVEFSPTQLENRELPDERLSDLDAAIEVFGKSEDEDEKLFSIIRGSPDTNTRFSRDEWREKLAQVAQYRKEIQKAKSEGKRDLERGMREARRALIAEIYGQPLPSTSSEDFIRDQDRVYRAINRSIKKIGVRFEAFGKHVDAKVERKSTFRYNMGPDARWRVDFL